MAKVFGDTTVAGDGFGTEVALSEEYALIGAPGHAGRGRAHLFEFSGAAWSQVAELRDADGTLGARFGGAVAVGGEWAVVGAGGDESEGEETGAALIFWIGP